MLVLFERLIFVCVCGCAVWVMFVMIRDLCKIGTKPFDTEPEEKSENTKRVKYRGKGVPAAAEQMNREEMPEREENTAADEEKKPSGQANEKLPRCCARCGAELTAARCKLCGFDHIKTAVIYLCHPR